MNRSPLPDDLVAPFSLDNAPVRGRAARLGPLALDPILRRHDYPRCAAMLLGEALTLAALVQSLLKADGRLIVQAQGAGLVPLLVAEVGDGGALRGYARLADGAAEALAREHRVAPADLLGAFNGGPIVPLLSPSPRAARRRRRVLTTLTTRTTVTIPLDEAESLTGLLSIP